MSLKLAKKNSYFHLINVGGEYPTFETFYDKSNDETLIEVGDELSKVKTVEDKAIKKNVWNESVIALKGNNQKLGKQKIGEVYNLKEEPYEIHPVHSRKILDQRQGNTSVYEFLSMITGGMVEVKDSSGEKYFMLGVRRGPIEPYRINIFASGLIAPTPLGAMTHLSVEKLRKIENDRGLVGLVNDNEQREEIGSEINKGRVFLGSGIVYGKPFDKLKQVGPYGLTFFEKFGIKNSLEEITERMKEINEIVKNVTEKHRFSIPKYQEVLVKNGYPKDGWENREYVFHPADEEKLKNSVKREFETTKTFFKLHYSSKKEERGKNLPFLKENRVHSGFSLLVLDLYIKLMNEKKKLRVN